MHDESGTQKYRHIYALDDTSHQCTFRELFLAQKTLFLLHCSLRSRVFGQSRRFFVLCKAVCVEPFVDSQTRARCPVDLQHVARRLLLSKSLLIGEEN